MVNGFVIFNNVGKINIGQEVISDCDHPRRYDKVFDKKTVDQFLVLMAVFLDFDREIRIKRGPFCSVLEDILASVRSVLVVNGKCGGTTTVQCNGCGNREGAIGAHNLHDVDIGENY